MTRPSRRARLTTALAAGAAALALALVPVASAAAHDYLVGSDPAAGSTVDTALDTVALTFNDRVLDLSGDGRGTLVTVTGPDAATKHFETGCATVADTDVTAPVALGGAGTYTVTYQIVSADGHTVSDSLSFDYRPPAGTAEATGSDATPCGAATTTAAPTGGSAATAAPSAPSTSGAVVSTAQPTTTGRNSDLGLVIGIAAAIVVLALIGVVVVILTGLRGRPAPGSGTSDSASAGRASDRSEDRTGSDE